MWLRATAFQAATIVNRSITVDSFKPEIVFNALQNVLNPEDISVSKAVRDHHGHDESWHRGEQPPDIVVSPRSTAQVSELCRLCHAHAVPIIPYGTGTGLEGGVVALRGGVCVDLANLDGDPEVHADDFVASVGAGVTRLTLNDHLRDSGLFFPIDPGADASVCGMVATNASGTNAVKYGAMKDNVVNLEVVLADGRILHTAGLGRHTKKSAAGYNLSSLFVGSEGTLGVITGATVKLYPRPAAVAAAVCTFPSDGAAVEATVQILQCGIPVARVEFLDEAQVAACNNYSHLGLPVLPTLFFEFNGCDDEDVDKQAANVGQIVESNGGGGFEWARLEEDRRRLWRARHDAWYAAKATRPGCIGLSTDVCVPISRLPDVLKATKEDMKTSGISGTIVGHVGDGNFHTLLFFEPDNAEEKAALEAFNGRLVGRALDVGGTCTGEHSVGLGKRKWLRREFGDVAFDVMKDLKRTLDPTGIMNPGKKIDF